MEQRRDARPVEFFAGNFVHVAEVVVFPGGRAEGIDEFEVRRAGVQAGSIEDQVLVITDLDGIAAQGHHAFNVIGVLLEVGNSGGFEDDDFASFGVAEVVGQAIDEEVVAGDDLEFDDVLAFAELLARFDSRVLEDQVIGGTPGRAGRSLGGA